MNGSDRANLYSVFSPPMIKGDKERRGNQALGHGVLAFGVLAAFYTTNSLQLLLHLPAFPWWLTAHTAAFVASIFKRYARIY